MFKMIASAIVGGMLALSAFAGPASAATGTYVKPSWGGDRLDWCLNWGVGCGQQAADAYCVAKGYTTATSFGIDHNIGAVTRTRVISTGAVCDQGFCDGFTHITCYKPNPAPVFHSPKYGSNRLDWCVNWGVGCGKPAADKFCQWKGYASAVTFQIAHNIGASQPTRLIGTGAVCDQGFCDGFAYIKCN